MRIIYLIIAAVVAITFTSCYQCNDYDISECVIMNSSTLAIENNLEVPVYIEITWNVCEPTQLDYSNVMEMSVSEYKIQYVQVPVCGGAMVLRAEGYTFVPELKTIETLGCNTTKYQINPDKVNPGVAYISVGMTY